MNTPRSVSEIIENGLCIGCGLCAAMGPYEMVYTPEGRLRPRRTGAPGDDVAILNACPGAIAKPNAEQGALHDAIWGSFNRIETAWAGETEVRYRGATGGVLTALGMHLLRSGTVRFILHCAADPERPMRSRWFISDTPEDVLARAGSRYGPSDTLAGLEAVLALDAPFAVIAKPCDAGAVQARAEEDPRISKNLKVVLVMVCGGASDLGKSQSELDAIGVQEEDLALFRYRGHGNPGPTRIETRAGAVYEKSYQEMWQDETGWRIQSRCKICPDALGEAADIAAADIWPGGLPSGEDDGFNGVISRTAAGERLLEDAQNAGALVAGRSMTPDELSATQPHQVAKKQKLAARLRGMSAAGAPIYTHKNLRIETLDHADPSEEEGTYARVKAGRFREKVPPPRQKGRA